MDCVPPVSYTQLLDMKIFVDTDSDIRLVRRLRRDIAERGRDIEGVIKQYNKFVKPAFDQYIEPSMRLADIVVPRGKMQLTSVFLFCRSLMFLLFITAVIFHCSLFQGVVTWWPSTS